MKKLAIVIAGVLSTAPAFANLDLQELSLSRNAEYLDNQVDVRLNASDDNAVGIIQVNPAGLNEGGNTAQALLTESNGNTAVANQRFSLNDARLILNKADDNNIRINQSRQQDADIKLQGADDNKVTVIQRGFDNDAVVQVLSQSTDYSNENVIKLTQRQSNNDARIILKASDLNKNITVEQNQHSNDADISLTKSNGNSLTLTQSLDNEAKVVLLSSDTNVLNIEQDSYNIANVRLDGSDDNTIDLSQVNSNSFVNVSLTNSHGNDGGLIAEHGIQVMQAYEDYASISLTNSDNNAIYVDQN